MNTDMTLNEPRNSRGPRETHARSCISHAAFTLIELLIVVAILAIIMGMMPISPSFSRAKARRIKCVNNLKNVGLAYRIYANDSGGRFPWQIPGEKAEIQINYSTDPTT